MRQRFVFFIGIVELISGLGLLGMVVWSILGDLNLPQEGDILSLSMGGLLAHFIFLGLLMTLAGVGLIQKKSWGWTLTVFYLSYFVLRSINALFFIPWFAERVGNLDPQTIQEQYLKHAVRIILGILLIHYFYRDKVTTAFGLSFNNKLESLAGLLSKAFVVLLFMAALSRIL